MKTPGRIQVTVSSQEGSPLIISYEGRDYPYDPDDMDIDQALMIEKHIDGPMLDYQKGLVVASAKCFQALGWIVLHNGDLTMPIASVNFKFNKLASAFDAAAEAEKAAEPGPPTALASNGQLSTRASTPSESAASAAST